MEKTIYHNLSKIKNKKKYNNKSVKETFTDPKQSFIHSENENSYNSENNSSDVNSFYEEK